MSKFSIAWHETGLANRRLSLKKYEEELSRIIQTIRRCEAEIAHAESQISRAKALGKTEFDPERFMKSSSPDNTF